MVKPSESGKKKSPSSLKRSKARKEAFIMKKSSSNGKPLERCESELTIYKCDDCELSFRTATGLKIHVGRKHKRETLRELFQLDPSTDSGSDEEMREERLAVVEEEEVLMEEEVEKEELVVAGSDTRLCLQLRSIVKNDEMARIRGILANLRGLSDDN